MTVSEEVRKRVLKRRDIQRNQFVGGQVIGEAVFPIHEAIKKIPIYGQLLYVSEKGHYSWVLQKNGKITMVWASTLIHVTHINGIPLTGTVQWNKAFYQSVVCWYTTNDIPLSRIKDM